MAAALCYKTVEKPKFLVHFDFFENFKLKILEIQYLLYNGSTSQETTNVHHPLSRAFQLYHKHHYWFHGLEDLRHISKLINKFSALTYRQRYFVPMNQCNDNNQCTF